MSKFSLLAALGIAFVMVMPTMNAEAAHTHRPKHVRVKHLQESKPDPVQSFARDLSAAIQAKDVDRIMSHYVKSDDLIVFDVLPPIEYRGWEAYRKDWQDFFGQVKSLDKADLSDLHAKSSGSLAYYSAKMHLEATMQDDKKINMDLRITDVLQKTGGKWLIIHEHVSVPANLGG